MYKNCVAFYPNHIYPSLNFNTIKKSFKDLSNDYRDFGTIITIKNEELMISINNKGKTDIYYNNINDEALTSEVKKIESLFKEQIIDFKLEKKYSQKN
jgi:ureidoglycolate hydrolase